jgi:DNA gyrase subunit A
MTQQPKLTNVTIEDEMKSSFMDYAMSVIISRALPDARDGLKPVHRRILYTMQRLRNFWNQPYMKSARVVGETMGKLHPHGDASIYDALVRMAQSFSMSVPLADGQGNFGSIDGDPPAAMRYTEVRMAKVTGELLADIDKETVEFVPNYDDKDEEPVVMPTRFPNLLVNGSAGIAVGMATNIPPHNLGEILRATVALINDPHISTRQLMEHVPGPDFPTGGIIYGRGGIYSAFETGRGGVVVRAKADIEELEGGRSRIVVTEIPYQVNKSRLLEKIADLVKEKRLEHISDIRDESDRQGLRVVVTLKKDAPAEVVLNKLYKLSPLQNSFGVNMVAIVDRKPQMLTLKSALKVFVRHRRMVIIRRSQYELRQALDRLEVVEGLGLASVEIDTVIRIIRNSLDPEEARQGLMEHEFTGLRQFLIRAGRPEVEIEEAVKKGKYRLSERQAQAILDMRLHRLTGLQQEKLASEYADLCHTITELRKILGDEQKLKDVMISELEEIEKNYAIERRTEIIEESGDITVEDLIADEPMVVTMTLSGYVKRTPLSEFKAQQRGGRGRRGAKVRSEDELATTFVASALSHVLLFTNNGRAFCVKVYEIPKGAPHARGKPFVNVVDLQDDEKVMQMLPVSEFEPDNYIVMATSRGTVKKTELMAFANIRANGIIAIVLEEGDSLIEAKLTDGEMEVLLATAQGRVVRFSEEQVRAMGRVSRGVRGIKLRSEDSVVSMATVVPESDALTLTVTERGYGKLTHLTDYPTHNRGGLGVLAARLRDRDGRVVSLRIVDPTDDVMLVTSRGTVIRTPVEGISIRGRVTTGVTLVRVSEDEAVMAVVRLPEEEEEDEEEGVEEAEADIPKQQEELGDEPEGEDGAGEQGEEGQSDEAPSEDEPTS